MSFDIANSLGRLRCWGFAIELFISAGQPTWALERILPPPAAAVAPLIGETYSNDANQDRIEDQLLAQYQQAMAAQPASSSSDQKTTAAGQLARLVDLELIFKAPVTQEQMDAFLQLGGEITHVYKAISHGWNGRLPLGRLLEVPGAVGDKLVLLEEAKITQAHLDLATRTGRVRPVWSPGFAGNARTFDKSVPRRADRRRNRTRRSPTADSPPDL